MTLKLNRVMGDCIVMNNGFGHEITISSSADEGLLSRRTVGSDSLHSVVGIPEFKTLSLCHKRKGIQSSSVVRITGARILSPGHKWKAIKLSLQTGLEKQCSDDSPQGAVTKCALRECDSG